MFNDLYTLRGTDDRDFDVNDAIEYQWFPVPVSSVYSKVVKKLAHRWNPGSLKSHVLAPCSENE